MMLLEEAVEAYMNKLTEELVNEGFNYDGSVVSSGITKAFMEMTVDQITQFISEINVWEDIPENDSAFLAIDLTVRNAELVAFMFNFCPAWVNEWFKNEINYIGEYFNELR